MQKNETFVGVLATIAEVLSGIAGILFAVIVFGVQFHGEKLGKASFLVRYLGRREGLMPIAAFTFAVICGNIISAILGSYGLVEIAKAMAVLDLVLIPAVLLLTMWLLSRMVTSVSGDFFEDSLIPGLTFEFQRAMDTDTYYANLIEHYTSVLEQGGSKRMIGADLFTTPGAVKIPFPNCANRAIKDVSLVSLANLNKFLQTQCVKYDASFTIGPGDVAHNKIGLVLSRSIRGASQDDETSRLDKRTQLNLCKLLSSTFSFGRTQSRDVIEVLNRFFDVIVSQARHDSADVFERALAVQEHLISQRLQRVGAKKPAVSLYRAALPDYLGSLQHFEMTRAVVDSGEKEKAEVLFRFAANIMLLAIDHKQPTLFHEAGSVFTCAYFWTQNNHPLRDFVSENVDTYLHIVLGHFRFGSNSEPTADEDENVMPTLVQAQAWVLLLIRYAIESSNSTDARNFHSRLSEWDRHHSVRDAIQQGIPVSKSRKDALALHQYTETVIAGWAIQCAGTASAKNQVAMETLKYALSQLGSRNNVIEAWCWAETYEIGPEKSQLRHVMGFSHWTLDQLPRRTGDVIVSAGPTDTWIIDGLLAAILARPTIKNSAANQICNISEIEPWITFEQFRRKAEELLNCDFLRVEMLGFSDSQKQAALTGATSLFSDWCRCHKLSKLNRIINSAISPEKVEALRQEIIGKLPKHPILVDSLLKITADSQNTDALLKKQLPFRVPIPKRLVVANSEVHGTYGDAIAQDLTNLESDECARTTEQLAAKISRVSNLAHVTDGINHAISELVRDGYRATVILLPDEPRFRRAVFGNGCSTTQDCKRLGPLHLGIYEGCNVFRSPFADTASIVVTDANAFYGPCPIDCNSALTLKVTEPDSAARQQFLASQEKRDAEEIADADQIQVKLELNLHQRIGVRDVNGGIRIDLSELRYAIQDSDQLFHRIGCNQLRRDSQIEFRLVPLMNGEAIVRSPCPVCNPDT